MHIQAILFVSAALLAGISAFAAEDVNEPVRPIGVNGQEAWNGRATSFLYAPTFGFKTIAGAAKYRFSVNGRTFEATVPTAALSPVWGEVPVGWVTVEARGVAADGRDLGVAGARRFWKKAAYRPGAYPPAVRPYGKAAELALLNVLNSKSIAILEKTGDIDRAYPHNCYPAKMLAQVVTGMLELAKMRPDLKARAVGVAEKAADWMIAHSIAAPSPLAGFPVTYDHHPEAAKVEPTACARISKERAGISMNIYPGYMGRAYVALYEADGKAKYLAAAEAIAARYLAMQGEDGTWALNQRIADGAVVGANRVMPIQCVIPLFEALARVTGKAVYREGADRAFAFIERGPLKTWNWEGQFEDTPQAPKYQNLTKHDACSTAIYLLSRFPGDKGRLAQARELLRFAEDQFVFWEKPYTSADEPKEFVEWNRPWAGKWECPGVTEQYSCYRPIDASASKLIQTYLALYRAERNPLDLQKAKTLGDQATRMQRTDGFIPTFWSDHPHVVHDNWVNCMLYTAETLAELSRSGLPPGLGVTAHVTRDEFGERKRAFALMREAGFDAVRCDFDWRWYQKAKDAPIDWKRCDAVVDDAAEEIKAVDPAARVAFGACVVRFGSDFKGALVLTGSADGRSGSSETAQARNCLDMIEISRQTGIEQLFFYEFQAPEKDPYCSEDHFGIVHKDFSPKPAYESLRERHVEKKNESLVVPSGDATALVQGRLTARFLRAAARCGSARGGGTRSPATMRMTKDGLFVV